MLSGTFEGYISSW